MTWHITEGPVGAQAIADTSTTQNHPLGTIVQARDPTYGAGEFIYLLGAASTVARDWVTYNADDWSTTRTGANAIGPVAIAMSANVASQYGWYQISGKAQGAVLTGFTDNGIVFLTSTASTIDDTSVAGDLVFLAKGASAVANTGSTPLYADFEISRPFVADRAGNT